MTDVFGAGFAEIFSADILIAALSVPASDPAALVAEKFHLVFLRLRQTVQLSKGFVQPEIRHHIAELLPGRLRPELLKLCLHFRRGGHEIKLRIVCFQVVQQQLRAVSYTHLDVYKRQALLCRYRYLLARARELGLHTILKKYQPLG